MPYGEDITINVGDAIRIHPNYGNYKFKKLKYGATYFVEATDKFNGKVNTLRQGDGSLVQLKMDKSYFEHVGKEENVERDYELEVGDVVLVTACGWGFRDEDLNKYVEITEFTKYVEGYDGVKVKPYDCELKSTTPKVGAVGIKSFGENPMVLLNTGEMTKEDELIGKEFQVDGEGYIYKIHAHDEDHYFVRLSDSEIFSEGQTHKKKMVETRINEGVWVLVENQTAERSTEQYTGSSSNYYKVYVKHPTTLPDPYEAECNDIIESLQMTFAEGNAFKAIWRKAKARQGVKKKGYDNGVYDSEKVVFFGERMLIEAKDNE